MRGRKNKEYWKERIAPEASPHLFPVLIKRLCEQGFTFKQIAAMLGRPRIWRILEENNGKI